MTLPARLITSALFRGVFIAEPSPTDHPFVPEDNPASVEKTRAPHLHFSRPPTIQTIYHGPHGNSLPRPALRHGWCAR